MQWFRSIKAAVMLAALCAAGFGTAPAAAQATRTWVSGVGDDVNPCSRTAPCKTFAGAISKTAAGGEINCLDPGGFGAVTITKSMTIDCRYTEGGVLAGGNGITINAQPEDSIYLRGLDVFGVNPPTHGVRFVRGGSLTIEDVVIRRFNSANSAGVSFAPQTNATLIMRNVTVSGNGNAAGGGGIDVRPAQGAAANVLIVDSLVANNTGVGISGTGADANVRVGNTVIFANSVGISAKEDAKIASFGDNRLAGNTADGAFTGPVAKK